MNTRVLGNIIAGAGTGLGIIQAFWFPEPSNTALFMILAGMYLMGRNE